MAGRTGLGVAWRHVGLLALARIPSAFRWVRDSAKHHVPHGGFVAGSAENLRAKSGIPGGQRPRLVPPRVLVAGTRASGMRASCALAVRWSPIPDACMGGDAEPCACTVHPRAGVDAERDSAFVEIVQRACRKSDAWPAREVLACGLLRPFRARCPTLRSGERVYRAQPGESEAVPEHGGVEVRECGMEGLGCAGGTPAVPAARGPSCPRGQLPAGPAARGSSLRLALFRD